MASRAIGAFLAIAAAAAIVVSIASSAWWAGPPVVDGKVFEAKYVHVGPIGATGCNVGGEGACETIAIDQQTQMLGYAALGASALATLFLFILMSAALRVSDHRRGIATTSLLFTLLAGGASGAMLALGPGIDSAQVIEVPIGWGTFVYGGGLFASLLASFVTRRLEPEPLRLKPSLQKMPALYEDREPQQPVSGEMRSPAAQLGIAAVTPPPQERIDYAMTPLAPSSPDRVNTPMPRMAPSTPALRKQPTPQPDGARGNEGSTSSPRIRPPHEAPGSNAWMLNDGSSPRVRPSADDEPVSPFARTHLPDASREEESGARPRLPDEAAGRAQRHDDSSARMLVPDEEPMSRDDARAKRPSDPGVLGPVRAKRPSERELFGDASSAPPGLPGMPPRSSAPNLPGMPPRSTPPTTPPSLPGTPRPRNAAFGGLPGSPPPGSSGPTPPGPPPRLTPPVRDNASGPPPRPTPPVRDNAGASGPTPPGPPPRLTPPSRDNVAASGRDNASEPPSRPNQPGRDNAEPPSRPSPSSAPSRPSPSSSPPVFSTPLARSNPPSSPPPFATPIARSNSPSSPPPFGGSRPGGPSTPPPFGGSRPASDAGDDSAPARRSPSSPPSLGPARPGSLSSPPPPQRIGNSTAPLGSIPGTASPGKPPELPRTRAPSIPPVRSVVPSPGPRGKSIVVPEHLRASTEPGTPPPNQLASGRPSESALAPPPVHNRTLAYAVPPMPILDGDARRASTDSDSSLEDALRETDHLAAVQVDDDSDDDSDAVSVRSPGVPKRASTDVRTGGNRIGENTAVGLQAAPPAPAIHPGDDEEWNRAGSQSEHTAQTDIAELVTGDTSKTPIPTLERQPQTPIPTLEVGKAPASTAPSSLPPPKQVDSDVPSGPTPACPQCESPMSWVEEHLRFYCRSCRMYF